MNYLVIYPGRFHPFHLGHKASYDYLVNKYGPESVYIATSDKQAPVTSPFSYSDKVEMMTKLGVPAGHVVKVRNPYQATEITDNLTPEQRADTVLIFAVSAKDAERFNFKPKKDGSASYIQPLPESLKKLKPMTKSAYIDITPTVNFKVRGQDANSASAIRQMFIDGNDTDRDQIITDLYGAPDSSLRDMFKKKLGITDHVVRMMQECRRLGTARSLALMERIVREERAVLNEFAPDPDFRDDDDDDDDNEYPTTLKNKNGQHVGDTIQLTTGEWAWQYYKLDRTPRGPFYSFDILGQNFATEREAYASLKAYHATYTAQQLREFAPGEPGGNGDDDVPELIYQLANRWWNNTDNQDRIAMVLRSMGWDIQQSDGEEDVCQLTYRDGTVYYLDDGEFDPELYETVDYIEEKWSAKYKRSINCANPRGFSQQAHCAGRKK
jgi:hypothetical protein